MDPRCPQRHAMCCRHQISLPHQMVRWVKGHNSSQCLQGNETHGPKSIAIMSTKKPTSSDKSTSHIHHQSSNTYDKIKYPNVSSNVSLSLIQKQASERMRVYVQEKSSPIPESPRRIERRPNNKKVAASASAKPKNPSQNEPNPPASTH
jgi:hypothetical protein